MRSLRLTRPARLAAAAACLATAGALALPLASPASAVLSEGIQCETSPTSTFDLYANDGYITTADGNSIYAWGFATSPNGFQLPGATLCVTAGDAVTVTLHNSLREQVSIIFPGQQGVRANGTPAQPELGAGGQITSLTPAAAAYTGTVTYSFTARDPGTFIYESGTDQRKQVEMGLYGALVVRPQGHPDRAYDRADSVFNPANEYLHVLSQVDPAAHLAVERNRAFNWKTYRARYFMINGRTMPDTLAPNNAAWLPSQPYGAMVHIRPVSPTNLRPALVRYVNVGNQTYPFHPHGNFQRVIGRDGHSLEGTSASDSGADLGYDKFLIDVGPGQTVDTTLSWTDVELWDPVTNPIPVELPPLADQLVSPDTWFSESPYLGRTGDLPAGVTSLNQCGEYYHVAHSHALQHATNYGASFGGMMTLIRIDPPSGCGTTP